MDRLTDRWGENTVLLKGGKTVFSAHPPKTQKTACAIARLAEYEDTGMTPQEIMEAEDRRHNCKIECLLREYNKVMEELKRYKDAEAEGRLVMSPVGEGDTVFRVGLYDGHLAVRRYAVVSFALDNEGCTVAIQAGEDVRYFMPVLDVGMSIFLTRESAENALRERQGHGEGGGNA